MKIITTREIRQKTKTFFDLAEKERVIVKRGNKYVNLIVTTNPEAVLISEDWLEQFMSIPEQYRVNPFEISPSGDLFYADKRNLEHINKSIIQAKNGQTKKLTKEDQKTLFNLQ